MTTLDAMHRMAMRKVYHGADVSVPTISALLLEVAKIAPAALRITNYPGGRKIFYAELTAMGRNIVDGKPVSNREGAATLAKRQARFKAKLLKSGGRRTSLNLRPNTVGYIAVIQKHKPDMTVADIVEVAIEGLARKLHNASKEKT